MIEISANRQFEGCSQNLPQSRLYM